MEILLIGSVSKENLSKITDGMGLEIKVVPKINDFKGMADTLADSDLSGVVLLPFGFTDTSKQDLVAQEIKDLDARMNTLKDSVKLSMVLTTVLHGVDEIVSFPHKAYNVEKLSMAVLRKVLEELKEEATVKIEEPATAPSDSGLTKMNAFSANNKTGGPQSVTRSVRKEEPAEEAKAESDLSPLKVLDRAGTRTILVYSLAEGCGSTFISTNLAQLVAGKGKLITWVEGPTNDPSMIKILNLNSNYLDAFNSVEVFNPILKSSAIKENTATWFPLSGVRQGVKPLQYTELINKTRVNTLSIIDGGVSWETGESLNSVNMVDEIWCVFEPNMKHLEAKLTKFKALLSTSQSKIKLVGNKFDDYSRIAINNINGFKGINTVGFVPIITPATVSKAIWNDKLVSTLPEAETEMRFAFGGLIAELGAR